MLIKDVLMHLSYVVMLHGAKWHIIDMVFVALEKLAVHVNFKLTLLFEQMHQAANLQTFNKNIIPKGFLISHMRHSVSTLSFNKIQSFLIILTLQPFSAWYTVGFCGLCTSWVPHRMNWSPSCEFDLAAWFCIMSTSRAHTECIQTATDRQGFSCWRCEISCWNV